MTDAEQKRLWALADKLQWHVEGGPDGEYCTGRELATNEAGDALGALLTELGYPRPEGE